MKTQKKTKREVTITSNKSKQTKRKTRKTRVEHYEQDDNESRKSKFINLIKTNLEHLDITTLQNIYDNYIKLGTIEANNFKNFTNSIPTTTKENINEINNESLITLFKHRDVYDSKIENILPYLKYFDKLSNVNEKQIKTFIDNYQIIKPNNNDIIRSLISRNKNKSLS